MKKFTDLSSLQEALNFSKRKDEEEETTEQETTEQVGITKEPPAGGEV